MASTSPSGAPRRIPRSEYRPRRSRFVRGIRRVRKALAGGGWALLGSGVASVAIGAGSGRAAWTFLGLSLMLAGAVVLIMTGAPATWD